MNPFIKPQTRSSQWHRVGLASTFPDIQDGQITSCQTFNISSPQPESSADIKNVLVFKYRGKFHAIDHQCPHSSFPLSQGSLFDIEDFGVVLSAGITCPKHGWSFDLFSGQADRGNYKLGIWEVQLRDLGTGTGMDQEVWVRRKQRIG